MFEGRPQPLTPEERTVLKEYLSSDPIRLMRKAFHFYAYTVQQKLLAADQVKLPVIQGQLMGIAGCTNLIDIEPQMAPKALPDEEELPKPARPLVSASKRVKPSPKV